MVWSLNKLRLKSNFSPEPRFALDTRTLAAVMDDADADSDGEPDALEAADSGSEEEQPEPDQGLLRALALGLRVRR